MDDFWRAKAKITPGDKEDNCGLKDKISLLIRSVQRSLFRRPSYHLPPHANWIMYILTSLSENIDLRRRALP
jgi:hypothetical protein